VYWDRRRFVLGLLGGIVATWALWTLLCYPLLVQLAAQGRTLPTTDTSTPWSLLLSATPLGFGMFSVMAGYGVWFVPLFLVLYGLTPFVWARRAQNGAQPGLAFGLGTILGFIWMPAAIIAQWQWYDSALIFVIVGAIWLLGPVALGAGWVGRLSLAWKPGAFTRGRAGSSTSRGKVPSRIAPAIAVTVCLGLALVGVSAWSAARDGGLRAPTPPPLSQQIQSAQAHLPFALRQPHFVPAGVVLASVTAKPHSCLNPCVDLSYQGAHGAWLGITEIATTPSPLGFPLSTHYQVSQGSLGEVHAATWWLGGRHVTSVHEINITWERDGIAFLLFTNAAWPVAVVEHVASSL
jgi:hypothetical protein